MLAATRVRGQAREALLTVGFHPETRGTACVSRRNASCQIDRCEGGEQQDFKRAALPPPYPAWLAGRGAQARSGPSFGRARNSAGDTYLDTVRGHRFDPCRAHQTGLVRRLPARGPDRHRAQRPGPSAARGAPSRQASPRVRHAPPPASGRSTTSSSPAPDVTPPAIALCATGSLQSSGDHLHQRMQAGRGEGVGSVAPHQAARRQRLVAQTMPILQQQQPFGGQCGNRDLVMPGQRMTGGECGHEGIAHHAERCRPPQSQGSANNATSSRPASSRSIRRSVVSSRRNICRWGNAARSAGISRGNRNGPTVGMTPRRSFPLIGARAIAAVSATASRAASASRAPGHQIAAKRREHHPLAAVAFKDAHVELALQRQHAGRQRRLRHRAGLGGAAKMLVLGKGGERSGAAAAWTRHR